MDGHPLYHYARQNLPLPRPVEPRPCKIHSLVLTSWSAGGSHAHRWPTEKMSEADRAAAAKVEEMVERSVSKPKKAAPAKITVDEDGPSLPTVSVGQKRKSVANGDGAPTRKKPKIEDPRSQEELEADDGGAPVFGISMDVSSGTYVRTIVQCVPRALLEELLAHCCAATLGKPSAQPQSWSP